MKEGAAVLIVVIILAVLLGMSLWSCLKYVEWKVQHTYDTESHKRLMKDLRRHHGQAFDHDR